MPPLLISVHTTHPRLINTALTRDPALKNLDQPLSPLGSAAVPLFTDSLQAFGSCASMNIAVITTAIWICIIDSHFA